MKVKAKVKHLKDILEIEEVLDYGEGWLVFNDDIIFSADQIGMCNTTCKFELMDNGIFETK